MEQPLPPRHVVHPGSRPPISSAMVSTPITPSHGQMSNCQGLMKIVSKAKNTLSSPVSPATTSAGRTGTGTTYTDLLRAPIKKERLQRPGYGDLVRAPIKDKRNQYSFSCSRTECGSFVPSMSSSLPTQSKKASSSPPRKRMSLGLSLIHI